MAFAPWHPAQPFERYSCAPSLTVPFPSGSSSPVGPMEISQALISSAVGVRPTPNVPDCCASTVALHISNATAKTLSEAIGDAPVAGDLPRLNAVVETLHAEGLVVGLIPVFRDLFSRRLNLADFVRAARQDLGLFAVPIPHQSKPRVRHALRRSLELGLLPLLAAVGGNLHQLDRAATGPCEAADLIEAFTGQLLSGGRERDDGLRTDLIAERRGLRIAIEMYDVV